MFQNIPLSEIDPNPNQPRSHFSGISELAESIRDEGLLEPLMVRPSAAGEATDRFQIVHGERRFRACKQADLKEVPALVREVDDKAMFRLSVVENVLRNNLTAMEEARSYQRLQDEGHTQKQIGRIIGRGQSYVAHKLRLLKQPELLTFFLERDAVTENHFRQIMRLKNIVGEDAKDRWTPHRVDPKALPKVERDFRWTSIALVLLRPMGSPHTALPVIPKSRDDEARLQTVREAVVRFDQYVAKHTETTTWHRTATWWLSAVVGYGWTVAETQMAIDYYEDLVKSALAWHSVQMREKEMGSYDEYDWAVYHDLKHAGLLAVTGDADRILEALPWVGRRGGYAVPSDLQGREPFWDEDSEAGGEIADRMRKAVDEGGELPAPEKRPLEEIEHGMSRSIDRMWGGAVLSAESLRVMYHLPDAWKALGYASFGEYVETEFGTAAESVLREDGSLKPQRELARSLGDWGGDHALAEVLFVAARSLESEKFLELLEPRGEADWAIPVDAVLTEDGKPYPKPQMARNLHAANDE